MVTLKLASYCYYLYFFNITSILWRAIINCHHMFNRDSCVAIRQAGQLLALPFYLAVFNNTLRLRTAITACA